MPVHPPGQDGLRVEGVNQVHAFVIRLVAEAIRTVEDDILRPRAEARVVEDARQLNAVPFADRAPALDAVMPGDLGPVGRDRKVWIGIDSGRATRPSTVSRQLANCSAMCCAYSGVPGFAVPFERKMGDISAS